MKNSNWNRNRDFRPFRTKLLVRTGILTFLSVGGVWLLYSLVRGRFADWMVAVLRNFLGVDYEAALDIYWGLFRNYQDFILLLGMGILFCIVFRIYLNWFTKYFIQIDNGMDVLAKEDSEEVSLPPELIPIERKMNAVKRTIAEQKNGILASEQRKNDLIMYLAHDLKTPLASVIGYLSLLRDEKEISQELQEKYLSISLGKAERLEELINEFFEIARFNLSDITLQMQRINLTRLLEQLVFEFESMLREKNLRCKLCMAKDVMLCCDGDKIQRVFDNLLRNAVFYSFPDTEISIVGECLGDAVTIRFVNCGNTIPKEKLERIFEQFYRLDAARGTENGGAGLGLAIVKQIVELHNGTVLATSENERIEFAVTLPML